MRQLRYTVAMSLDGFIAGPKDEYDWIVHDPAFDFGALFHQFDTLPMWPSDLRSRAVPRPVIQQHEDEDGRRIDHPQVTVCSP
jgi:hypothetical protein